MPMDKKNLFTRETLLAALVIIPSLSAGIFASMHPSSQSCVYKDRGLFRQAIDLNLKAQQNPLFAWDPAIELDLAYCYRQVRDLEEASKHLALARGLGSKYGYLWIFRPHGLEYLLAVEEGWIEKRAEHIQKALAAFDRALDQEQSAEAYCGRAAVFEDLGKSKEALADYESAIKCSTVHDREMVYHEKALFHMDRGETDQAIADLTSALKAEPCNRALIDRAMLYRKQGYSEKALKDLSASVVIAGTERAYHERALLRFDRREFDEALKDIDHAIALDDTCPSLAKDRELILAESGKAQPQSQEQ